MTSPLPPGWARVELNELVDPHRGVAYGVLKPGPFTQGGIPMLRVKDLMDGEVSTEEVYQITPELDREFTRTKLSGGEVLLSIQGTVGKVAIAPPGLEGANVSRTLAVIPPAIPGLARWMWAALRSPQAQGSMAEATGGSTRDSLNLADVRKLELPVPPLAEQRRILARLDALFARSRAAKASLERVPELLDRVRQATLAAAFSGRLGQTSTATAQRPRGLSADRLPVVPGDWRWTTLGELAKEPICYGVVQPGEADGEVPLIRVCDLSEGTVALEQLRTVRREVDAEYSRSRVFGGEVLVSVVGTIGRVAVVPKLAAPANVARAVARICPSEQVDSRWLAYWLSSPFMQARLVLESREVARKTLNIDTLRSQPVPVAPPEYMAQTVAKLDAVIEGHARRLRLVEKLLARVEYLERALLQAAFRGDLLPQDPNDEPASVLLERLRAERAAPGSGRGKRGKSTSAQAQARLFKETP